MKQKPARFWKRGVAYIIDTFIISFIIMSPFSNLLSQNTDINTFADFIRALQATFSLQFVTITIVTGILALLYWSFMEWRFNQSVGKILLKLTVRNLTKKPITFTQALVRNLTKLSTIILLIDSIFIIKSKKNQRYFERLSKTQVTEEVMKF